MFGGRCLRGSSFKTLFAQEKGSAVFEMKLAQTKLGVRRGAFYKAQPLHKKVIKISKTFCTQVILYM